MNCRGRFFLVGLLALVCQLPWFSVKAQTVEYIHTDALGTPIAVTDANRVVIERSEYEPYGKLLNRPLTDGPGFTGHVQDAATGLTYMQQRYYDPAIGRMLSIDPVTAYGSGDWRHFNVYAYAYNNPYTFSDPDGRQSWGISGSSNVWPGVQAACGGSNSCEIEVAGEMAKAEAKMAYTAYGGFTVPALLRAVAAPFVREAVTRTGPKGVDPERHNANVTVRDKDGNIVSHNREVSGNMTDAEKKLGFPQNTLASHTEARAVQTPMKPGESMTITGQRAPCPSCKGKMNSTAEKTGAKIRYQWREDGKTNRWETK